MTTPILQPTTEPRVLRLFDLDHVIHLKEILDAEGYTDRISKIVSLFIIQTMCEQNVYRTTHLDAKNVQKKMLTALLNHGYTFTAKELVNLKSAVDFVCKDYYRSYHLFDI